MILDGKDNRASETENPEVKPNSSIHGLSKLALALINMLHELLERQAIRRMENGTLTDEEIDRVGECLMEQANAIDQLCIQFGVDRKELNIDLGPLGNLS